MIPNREQLLDIVRASPDRLSLRDLAREFGVKGNERRELRAMLRAMVKDGSLIMSKKKTYREAAALPRVMVMRITHIDDMGDMKGVPDQWDGDSAPPEFIILEGSASKKAKGHDSATLGLSPLINASVMSFAPVACRKTPKTVCLCSMSRSARKANMRRAPPSSKSLRI